MMTEEVQVIGEVEVHVHPVPLGTPLSTTHDGRLSVTVVTPDVGAGPLLVTRIL
jgi:hypothetical protein